jgi:hypothetical protein
MELIDYDWYEDGVLVEPEDFNENEHGPFEVSYEAEAEEDAE